MAAEDATRDLDAIDREIAEGTRRAGSCGVCDWIATRSPEEQATWDRHCASSVRDAGHQAIHRAMVARGFELASSKPIEKHRQRKHRVLD